MKNYNPCFLLLVSSIALITHVTAQHTVANVTLTETLFSSPGYIDSLPYAPNTTRDYRFQTYYPNHTLVLTVKEFVMEPADKNGDCLYDKVTVYDGYDDSSLVLNTLCGTISAGIQYQTTGDTVYVVFYSDATNPYKGFQMAVVSDGPTTTTSTSTTSTTSTTSSTTSTTSTTSTPPPTTSTTTKATTVSNNHGTTANPSQTQQPGNGDSNNSEPGNDNTIWIIVGCCVGGLLLIVALAIIVYCFVKDKRPVTPNGSGDNVKRVLWSRSNTTMVQPLDITKTSVPPGEIVQTNIFDLELPTGQGKANRLPPLSSQFNPPPKTILYE